MSNAKLFSNWLATLRPTGIEVVPGLHRALPGKLDAADVKPGEPIRAGGYGEDRSIYTQTLNEAEGDYGPTIILEHTPVPGLTFHTLYGHLSRDSLKGLKPGAAFMAGEKIGDLGTKRENGGWPPHLHFQIILEIGSAKGDYPGVCKRSEAERWLSICPDPAPLLGLPRG